MEKQKSTVYQKPWYVYMLRCQYTYIYTGISPDVYKRLEKHKTGKGARFTRNKTPIELVYVEKQDNVGQALIKEREIKRFSKQKKEQLIAQFQEQVPSITDPLILAALANSAI